MSHRPSRRSSLTLLPRKARPSICAGTWYPGDPEVLRRTVDGLVESLPILSMRGEVVALIVPHAGYRYSGGVAASAYAQMPKRRIDRILLIGPNHRSPGGDPMVVHATAYRTPLGDVPIDWEAVEALEGKLAIRRVPQDGEHSLEVQLPFLQRTLGEIRMVPIMLGDQSLPTARRLAKALGEIAGRGSDLLIGSSDLSHYHSYETAAALDSRVSDRIARFDVENLAGDLSAGRSEACGGGALLTAMLWAQRVGADRAEVLRYANSGDVTPEQGMVVGYLAGALLRTKPLRKRAG